MDSNLMKKICSLIVSFITITSLLVSCTSEDLAIFKKGWNDFDNALNIAPSSGIESYGGNSSSSCSACGGSGRVAIGWWEGMGQIDGTCSSCGGSGQR